MEMADTLEVADKGIFYVRKGLKDVFGHAEHQENGTSGLE